MAEGPDPEHRLAGREFEIIVRSASTCQGRVYGCLVDGSDLDLVNREESKAS